MPYVSRRTGWLIVLAVLTGVGALACSTQERSSHKRAEGDEIISRWAEGPTRAVAIQDGNAYFGNGGYLEVADISNPEEPSRVGRIELPGRIRAVAVSGDRAYVAMRGGRAPGLHAVDISDPSSPEKLGVYRSDDRQIYGLTYAEKHVYAAYTAPSHGGLQVIDVSDPSDPEGDGRVRANGVATDVAVADGYAYLTDRKQLHVISIGGWWGGPEQVSSVETGNAEDVTVVGDYAYVTNGVGGLRNRLGGGQLDVVDISDPETPRRIEEIEIGDGARDLLRVEDRLYVAGASNNLHVIDLADRSRPELVSSPTINTEAFDLAVGADHLFLASGSFGLDVWEESQYPVHAGRLPVGGSLRDVDLAGTRVYMTGRLGLSAIDISDPTALEAVDVPSVHPNITNVAVSGEHLILADGSPHPHSGSEGRLHVLARTDTAGLTPVGSVESPPVADLGVVGDRAYVLSEDDYGKELVVTDLSDPTRPERSGSVEISRSAQQIAVTDNRIYVARRDGEAPLTVRVPGPNGPQIADTLQLEREIRDVAASEGYVYGSDADGQVYVARSGEGTELELVSTFDTGDYYAWDVVAEGAYIYTNGGEQGWKEISVSDPSSPEVSRDFTVPGEALAVGEQGQLYVATQNAGLYVLSGPDSTLR